METSNLGQIDIGETMLVDGCEYEVIAADAAQVTFAHVEPIDSYCGPKCGEQRILTAKQMEIFHY